MNGDNLRCNIEGKYRRKKQVIYCIKQRSDRNWTGTGRPKVTDIDYNTVAPFYIYKVGIVFAVYQIMRAQWTSWAGTSHNRNKILRV